MTHSKHCDHSKKKLCCQKVYKLKQKDFASGTFRIKKPGTYILCEDIVFDPTLNRQLRPDLPVNDLWFAGITVETDNVTIDGRGHFINNSINYANKNLVAVWTSVCLGNNTFSGLLFGTGGSRFADTTSYSSCNNVTIKNLKVSYSTHFGIIGNLNDRVIIQDCNFSNCQTGDVLLLGARMSKITRNVFLGNSIPIPLTAAQSTLYLLRRNLQTLVDDGIPNAATYLNNLNAYVAANPGRFQSTQQNPSTLYGLFVYGGPTALFRLPTTDIKESIAESISDGRISEEVSITENVFENMTTTALELVAVGTNIPENLVTNLPFTQILLTIMGLFGIMEWQDLYNGNIFAPNDYILAIAFWCNYIYPLLPPFSTGNLPTNTQTIISSILNIDEATFNANAAPVVGIAGDGNIMKGMFGLRTIALHNSEIKNNKFFNINANGPFPINPTTLPGYANLTAPQNIIRTRMNDAWMISLELNKNVDVSNNECNTGTSAHGFYFAVDSLNGNDNVTFINNSVENISAPNNIVQNTAPNGLSVAYRNSNNVAGITYINNTTKNITSTNPPVLFPAASATVALINAISL